jgi:hypothetical protein
MTKWLNRWLYLKVRDMWDNRHKYEAQIEEAEYKHRISSNKMSGLQMGTAMVERGAAEGQDRITFELTAAVGGRILNVRRYDERKDRHDNQTYVIPSGEDVGARVAKILNLELIK